MKNFIEFNFKQFNWLFTKKSSYMGFRVRKVNLTICRIFYEKIGKPPKVSFEYDEKNKAILVCSDESNGWKITDTKNHALVISCKLSRVMPMGKYIYAEKENDNEKKRWICILDELIK